MKEQITQENLKNQVQGLARWWTAWARWQRTQREQEALRQQRLAQQLELTLLKHQLAETDQEIQRKTPGPRGQ